MFTFFYYFPSMHNYYLINVYNACKSVIIINVILFRVVFLKMLGLIVRNLNRGYSLLRLILKLMHFLKKL